MHLKHCALCTAELGALKRTDQLLATLPSIEPRRDLVGLVMQHIERERDTTPAFKRFLTSLRARQAQLRYAAANVLLVVVLALTIIRLENRRRAYQPAESRADVTSPSRDEPTGNLATDTGKGTRRWFVVFDPRRYLAEKRPTPTYSLTDEWIEALNEEFAKARNTGNDSLEAPGRNVGTDDVVPVDAPVILRAGPRGELLIENQAASTGPTTGDAAETSAGEAADQPGDKAPGE